MEENFKTYLGDSVYFEYENDRIVLYTDNGNGPENIIYLEPEVYESLVATVENIPFKLKQEKKGETK